MKLEDKMEKLKKRLTDNAKSYLEALAIFEEIKKLVKGAEKKERSKLARKFVEIKNEIVKIKNEPKAGQKN